MGGFASIVAGKRMALATMRAMPRGACTALRTTASLATGVMIAASFPPYGFMPFAFAGLAPLVAAVPPRGLAGLGFGWLAGLTAYALGHSWLPAVLRHTQGTAMAASYAWSLAYAAYHALPFAAFGWAVSRTRRKASASNGATPQVLAAAWVIVEWSFPKVFPWCLGDAFAAAPRFCSAAAVFGPYGLSYAAALCAAHLGEALRAASRSKTAWPSLRQAAVVPLAVAALGSVASAGGFGATGPSVSVAVVQGNLRASDDPRRDTREAWAWYGHASREAVKSAPKSQPEMIVWPETTLRTRLRFDTTFALRSLELAKELRSALLVGAPDGSPRGDAEWNAMHLIARRNDGAGFRWETYRKSRLLPFGEFIPAIAAWMGADAWHTTGLFEAAHPSSTPLGSSLKLAPAICFEAIHPGFFNAFVRRGAEVLVQLSDDSRFRDATLAEQHLNAVRMRAAETGRWLIRASNSGRSAIIAPDGTITEALPFDRSGVLRVRVARRTTPTIYTAFGDWIVVLSGALLAAVAAREGRLAYYGIATDGGLDSSIRSTSTIEGEASGAPPASAIR